MTWALLAIVFLPMLVEARRAARNERHQRARSGVEPEGDVYPIMRVTYPAAFLAMIVEGALRGGGTGRALVAGAAVFAGAKALKWWAIGSLGPAWTFRVIVVAGAPLVTHGPYRWMRHPNYVAVVGELAGTALMTGAPVAGLIGTILFAALIARRIVVENRALDAILRRH